MTTTLDIVQNAEQHTFQELYGRMDKDTGLHRALYKLLNAEGKEIPGAISVTLNDAAVFLNAVTSWIMNAKWQTVVEGDISAKQSHLIENFLEDCFASADDLLTGQGRPKLLSFLANHICARGWIGARWLWLGNPPHLECLPVDMRYCSYERDDAGNYKWVANRFRMAAGKAKDEFGITLHHADSEIEGIDYWDDSKEEIWIDGQLVPETQDRKMPNKHKVGKPPFVIMAAPEGFMFLDKGYLVHEGESIFFLNRNLYGEYNRIVSIDQSLAMQALAPPYQRPVSAREPPSEYPNEPGTVLDVPSDDKGNPELYSLVPRPDINMANRTSQAEISGALQRGGVNNIDLGNLQQPTTAIWITEQTEVRNKIIAPRLQAIEAFKEQSARMIIRQYQLGDFNDRVGKLGKRTKYTGTSLGVPETYTISYQGMSRSKKQEIANMALFNASQGISLETRLRDILMVDDPEGEIARIDAEKAEQADPVLFYLRHACALMDQAADLTGEEKLRKQIEANRMANLGLNMLQQVSATQVSDQANRPPGGNSNMLLPLMAGRNNGMGVT